MVELGDGGDVAFDVDGTAHYDDFLHTQKRLGVFFGGEGEVREWAEGDYRDCVGRVRAQELEDLQVGGGGSWDEVWRGGASGQQRGRGLGRGRGLEHVLPCRGGGEVRGLSVLSSALAGTLGGRGAEEEGWYGGVDIPEAVAAVEIVGDENLVFQRPVCTDRDNGREFLETAVARGEVVCETPFALFFEDVEHGDCIPQTAGDGQPVGLSSFPTPPPPHPHPPSSPFSRLSPGWTYFSRSIFPYVSEISSTSSSVSDAESASSRARTSSTL